MKPELAGLGDLIKVDERIGNRRAVNPTEHVAERTGAGRLERRASLVQEAKPDVWPCQGDLLNDVTNQASLARGRAQELQTGRDVEEKIADQDRRSGGTSPGLPEHDLASLQLELGTQLFATPAGIEGDPGDRGNAGKGLPPEAEGRDRSKVIDAGELTCGVPLERQLDLG